MNKYDFKNVKNIFVLGDCHGDFKKVFISIKMQLNVKPEDEEKPHQKEIERRERKSNRQTENGGIGIRSILETAGLRDYEPIKPSSKFLSKAFSNSLFILAGDSGIGLNESKNYEKLFESFNKVLSYNNSYVIFVRGNHDNPFYFDGEKINLSNIKAVPDYSVISAKGKNILCVGGAISMDRTWRIKQEERINRLSKEHKKKLYWDNEAPVFNGDIINDITKEIKIDCVVSHSAPSFVEPESRKNISEWSEIDSKLIDDIKEERITLDRVFEKLRDNGTKPKYWAYSHFDFGNLERRSDTIFRSVADGFSPVSLDGDMARYEEIDNASKKNKKISISNLNHFGLDGDNLTRLGDDNLGRDMAEDAHDPFDDMFAVGDTITENDGLYIEEGPNLNGPRAEGDFRLNAIDEETAGRALGGQDYIQRLREQILAAPGYVTTTTATAATISNAFANTINYGG